MGDGGGRVRARVPARRRLRPMSQRHPRVRNARVTRALAHEATTPKSEKRKSEKGLGTSTSPRRPTRTAESACEGCCCQPAVGSVEAGRTGQHASLKSKLLCSQPA